MLFVDLSHDFEDGMPGFRLKAEDGSLTQFSARIYPFMTHEQSRPRYQGLAEFEITEMHFQTSMGTYLDSPYHRFRDMRDIGELRLDEVILPADDSRDLSRPAHSLLLKRDILIVENLTNLHLLHGASFRFFAVPIKGRRVAAMPVRAFAEIL